jgi:hypothetical protein
MKWFYLIFLYYYFILFVFLLLKRPDAGRSSDRHMLVKSNSIWLNMFINVRLLAYHIVI